MKVLFMIPTLSVGGAEKVLVNLVNSMDKEKFDITVMSLFDGGVNKQFLSKNVKYVSCFKYQIRGNSHIFKLFSPQRLYRNLIKDRYDVIVSYLEGPTARIVSGCPYLDCKIVSWIHCTMHNKKEFSVGFRNYGEAKICYERFDKSIFVSNEVKINFLEFCKCDDRSDVIYNTNQSEKIIALSKEEITELYFKDQNSVKLCVVGKVIPVKGIDRLARIHKKLLNEGYNIQTFVLGVGSQQTEIQKYVEQEKFENSFHFMGYQTNPYKYVRNCDLFVCSSLSEGFSTAATESLIVGTPVITTRVSGMKELLGENEFGFITENNEEALYKGIKYLLDNPLVLNIYKKRASTRGTVFKTENTVAMVEKMLVDLVEKNEYIEKNDI